jgi:transposase
MVAHPEVVFVDALIRERVQYPPGAEAAAKLGLPDGVSPPDRWQLRTIRASIPALAGWSLSGVWYACRRATVRLRPARSRHYSPDPAYREKANRVCEVLGEMAHDPQGVVVVVLDELGFRRWPEPARGFALAPLRTQPAGKDATQRIAGRLDAFSGRVLTVDGHGVGRERLIRLYRQLDRAYPLARRIYVVQDNWPVHAHPDLAAALARLPRIERVWLPLAAHWLNPSETLWRKLRQEVLRMHRQADDWLGLRRAVRTYLRQFHDGSAELLDAVGLLGDGRLARARRGDSI